MEDGPVPIDIMQEWDQLEPDLAAAIDIVPEQVIDFVREKVVPSANSTTARSRSVSFA